MNDNLQKALSKNQEAVLYALDATALLQESMERLDAWPPAAKHLGHAMMAALLLQALTEAEDNETVSLQWMCDGPFGHLYAEARNYGEVRGTITNPRPDVQDYQTGLGNGVLQVRRARGGAGTTSVVNSVGVVTLDMVEYLEKSEQKNCGMNFSVVIDWEEDEKAKSRFRVKSALAYMIHILPQTPESKMNETLLRWDRQMQALGNISKWLLRPKHSTKDMLRLLTAENNPQISMNQRVKFSCNCNEERALRALTLLETQEKKEGIFQPEPQTEIRCEYCGKTYTVSAKGITQTSKEHSKTPRITKVSRKKTATKKTKAKTKPKAKPKKQAGKKK